MTLTDEEKIEEALRVIEDLMDILQRSRAGYQNDTIRYTVSYGLR